MANIAGLLALVVAEIFDWLADMLVMGGYALEVIWLVCRIAVMQMLVLSAGNWGIQQKLHPTEN